MATRTVYRLVDDLDGSTGDVAEYQFSYDGVDYLIDLSDHHIDQFRAALYPFIAAARRQPRTKAAKPAGGTGRGSTEIAAIRSWWHTHQHRDEVPAYAGTGRIPRTVRDAYRQATT